MSVAHPLKKSSKMVYVGKPKPKTKKTAAKTTQVISEPKKLLTNHVTLYSNGIGHFRRIYEVPHDGKAISIPFKSNDIADVLASLSVFGNVKFDSPPSFTPSNSNTPALKIDRANSLKSMLKGLSGSQIKFNHGMTLIEGTLVGLDSSTLIGADGKPFVVENVVVLTTYGLVSTDLQFTSNIEFTEEAVKAEITKALQENFQQIKPDSTFINLKLSALGVNGGKDELAVVQYTNPVAAWKMRYSIRSDKNRYFLEGTAIIDNNTNEDWNDFTFSVVTGNPNTFSTDLATVTVPTRQHIDLVEGSTQGYVKVSSPTGDLRSKSMVSLAGVGAKAAISNKSRTYSSSLGDDGDQEDMNEACYESIGGAAAVSGGVESKDVGDFCVYTANDQFSIASKRSAMVPMFTIPLTVAETILLFKADANSIRPFRALNFKNESNYSLGRGKVVIYQEGVFQGESILEAAKPGEKRMLTHCLENSVKITKVVKGKKSSQSSIRITKGVSVEETVHTSVSVYTVDNRKDEQFKLLIEHLDILRDATHTFEIAKQQVESETIPDGVRIYVKLLPKAKFTLTVTETYVESVTINLSSFHDINRITAYLSNPLAKDEKIADCVSIQSKIELKQDEISEAQEKCSDLDDQITRVRENIKAAPASKLTDNWVTDIDSSENQLRELKKVQIPKLVAEKAALVNNMKAALKKLTVAWKL